MGFIMKRKLFSKIILILFVSYSLLATACSDDDSSSASITLSVSSDSITMHKTGVRAASDITATGLESLQYYIRDIKLCQDLTIDGTGYSNTSGLYSLFSKTDAPDYNTFGAVDARSTTDGYIDFMDSTSLGSLTNTVNLDATNIGSYNYALTDWLQPIKVKGSIAVDGTTIYTHDGTVALSSSYYTTTSSTALTTSPSELAIAQLNNGGTWFRLLKPLEITQDDIDNNTQFKMLLVFNPDGFLFGWNNNDYTGTNNKIIDSNNNGFYIAFLDASPIAYRDGQTVYCESYTYTVVDAGNSLNFNARLEIYYVNEDSDNIYAATIRHLVNSSNTVPASSLKIFTVEDSSSILTFKASDDTAIVDNFTRLEIVSQTGTAVVAYYAGSTVTTKSVTYTFSSRYMVGN